MTSQSDRNRPSPRGAESRRSSDFSRFSAPDPAAGVDWWARPGAPTTGASGTRPVTIAHRSAGAMRDAAELRGGVPATSMPRSREHRLDGDASIREEVDRRLMADARFHREDLAIDVRQGCVTLDGIVESDRLRGAIESAVAGCGTVREIRNRLQVVPRARNGLNRGARRDLS